MLRVTQSLKNIAQGKRLQRIRVSFAQTHKEVPTVQEVYVVMSVTANKLTTQLTKDFEIGSRLKLKLDERRSKRRNCSSTEAKRLKWFLKIN